MALTFYGGVTLEQRKYSKDKPIRDIACPGIVCLPIEEKSKIYVKTGMHVLCGQAVAENDMPVFSSISGVVRGIVNISGKSHIAIENDGKKQSVETRGADRRLTDFTSEEICEIARRMAIVDSFDGVPLYKKLEKTDGVLRIIINCCEPDSYATSVYTYTAENPKSLIGGAKTLLYAFGAGKCVIAINSGRPELKSLLTTHINDEEILVVAEIENKHPICEETLISSIYAKEISRNSSAYERGYVTIGSEAVIQLYKSFVTGMPQVAKILTVSGECIGEPDSLRVPLGTPLKSIVADCGGLVGKCRAVVFGGVMCGEEIFDADLVVDALTDEILFLAEGKPTRTGQCINCGRCVAACPMRLDPAKYMRLFRNRALKHKYYEGIEACLDCGCCDYVCPARVPLTGILYDIKHGTRNAYIYEKKIRGGSDEDKNDKGMFG